MANIPDIPLGLHKDAIAKVVADMWFKYNQARQPWLAEKSELRAFLFATDTRKTSNNKLPWKNSTVTPKLTQIRDNLHANYMAALFPSENWFQWYSYDKESATKEKRETIEAYMRNKLKASGFELTVSQLVLDYIDYGNVIAGHEYIKELKSDPVTKEIVNVYTGPKAFRVSPLDCVFDPTAISFDKTPFMYRQLKSLGDLHNDVNTKPLLGYKKDVFDKALEMRHSYMDYVDTLKNEGLLVDGFGSLEEYLASNLVELIHFYGDYFDLSTKTLYKDQIITVIDRRWILRMEENKSWLGERPFKHCGWRLRPDNLWAQGPLDQLIGMQYRVDHLENLKADVFDQIAHPVIKIKGSTVEEFEFEPGAEIFCGEEGDVEFLRPDTTALNADMQIDNLMAKMEELAGAPKQAMGIRTPGEKTKYEVQTLENASGRIFQHKVAWFERNIIEPLINSMLEEARRNMESDELVKVIDPDYGVQTFMSISKNDILARGKLFPIGARHFAEQARFMQDITHTLQIVNTMPTVAVHISGKAIAQAIEENMGWATYNIVQENVALREQAETERMTKSLQEQLAVEDQINTGMPNEQATPQIPA